MSKLDKMYVISGKDYLQLLEDSTFLDHLRACGVDNWSGWGEDNPITGEYYEEPTEEDIHLQELTESVG